MTNPKRVMLTAALLVLTPVAWYLYLSYTRQIWSSWHNFATFPSTFEGFMGLQRLQLAIVLPDLVFFSVLGVVCAMVIQSARAWIWTLCIAIEIAIVRATMPQNRAIVGLSQSELFIEQLIHYVLPILVAVVLALLFMRWKSSYGQSQST
jgi:hypothetical protein